MRIHDRERGLASGNGESLWKCEWEGCWKEFSSVSILTLQFR